MMDSMTNEELDGKKQLNESRMVRIARGSGCRPEEVNFLLEEHKKFAKMVSKMSDMNIPGKANMADLQRNPKQMMEQMQKAIDPRILNQMGGMGNVMNMMKDLGNMEGMQDMMKQMMGGAGRSMPSGMPPGMAKKRR